MWSCNAQFRLTPKIARKNKSRLVQLIGERAARDLVPFTVG